MLKLFSFLVDTELYSLYSYRTML